MHIYSFIASNVIKLAKITSEYFITDIKQKYSRGNMFQYIYLLIKSLYCLNILSITI